MSKVTSKDIPIYAFIFSDLSNQIIDGTLAPGAILPSENSLRAKYGVSRETVRKGLKELEKAGLIYCLPRRGYFVSSQSEDQITIKLPKELKDCDTRMKNIRIARPAPDVLESLRISSEQPVLVITSINYKDSTAIGAQLKYIPYDKGYPSIEDEINFAVLPEAASAKSISFSYYTELSFKPALPPKEIQNLLKCTPEEALMMIDQLHISQAGKRIGFTRQYLLASYGELRGTSGYVQNK